MTERLKKRGKLGFLSKLLSPFNVVQPNNGVLECYFRPSKTKRLPSYIPPHKMQQTQTPSGDAKLSVPDHIKPAHKICWLFPAPQQREMLIQTHQTDRVILVIPSLEWDGLFGTGRILPGRLGLSIHPRWLDRSLWCEKCFWWAAVAIDSRHHPSTRDASLQKLG